MRIHAPFLEFHCDLQEMGLVENDESGGRMITKEGQRELDTVAVQAAAEEEEEED